MSPDPSLLLTFRKDLSLCYSGSVLSLSLLGSVQTHLEATVSRFFRTRCSHQAAPFSWRLDSGPLGQGCPSWCFSMEILSHFKCDGVAPNADTPKAS